MILGGEVRGQEISQNKNILSFAAHGQKQIKIILEQTVTVPLIDFFLLGLKLGKNTKEFIG